jgi:hypothetical protein
VEDDLPDYDGGFGRGITVFNRSKILVELNAELVSLRQRVETAKRAGAATELLEQRETAIVDEIQRLWHAI